MGFGWRSDKARLSAARGAGSKARTLGVTALGLMLGALAPASRALAAEDCIGFNPANVQAQLINGRWKVVDGGNWLMDFGSSQAEAVKARDIVKYYGMNQMCFVGRPNPPMTYFKISGAYPQGSYPGQDAIPLNPYNVKAVSIGGRWKVVDCGSWLLDFGIGATAQANAITAANLIKNNHLRYQAFVGRPDPGMSYWLADPAWRPSVSLSVTLRPQETNMWCWAASGRMTMEYLGHSVAQCTQANNRLGRSDCCTIASCPNPPGSDPCVQGGWPEYDKYGFTASNTSDAALSWDQLWEQFTCKGKPVAFSWHWPGGGGHMMVARGAKIMADGTQMVLVSDPWSPCSGDVRWITYSSYVSVAGDHTHWRDYYDITYGGT
jgi:hypothetical protein